MVGVLTEVTDVLQSLRGVWDEEAVDELDHALLAAAQAETRHPADDELVVAALLHDVAHSPLLAAAGQPHDEVARNWLTPRFGQRVGWLAGAHVVAKRHLAQVDPAYASALSDTSIRSLARQGGPAPVGPEWTEHPWWEAALELRRCDDAAKDPNASVPELRWAIEVVDRLIAAPR